MNWKSNTSAKVRATKLPNLGRAIGKSGGDDNQKIWTISNEPASL